MQPGPFCGEWCLKKGGTLHHSVPLILKTPRNHDLVEKFQLGPYDGGG